MKYSHRFQVKAPLSEVAAFHLNPASMAEITPPPIRVTQQSVPAKLLDGGVMDFTLWFGPLPIQWSAMIEGASEAGFIDRQISGPFSEWVHSHSFVKIDDRTTEVMDQITFRMKKQLIGGMVGLAFVAGLPVLFAYRGWKTRRLLERESVS